MRADAESFFDWWNILGFSTVLVLLLVFLVASLSPFVPSLDTGIGLLILTGVYAFTSFNQMRETRWSRKEETGMAVRPHFIDSEGEQELVLYNFGDGAALDLRLRVVLASEDGNRCFDLIDSNRTVHLNEGDYYSIFCEELRDLANSGSGIYEDASDKQLRFYYTWETRNGRQYPTGVDKPQDMPMDEIVCEADGARTVSLSEIQSKVA